MKKPVYLFLALLLPAFIFVFLKYAGRNEFNIPVYYESAVEAAPTDCHRQYKAPYFIPDSIAAGEGRLEANVLVFPGEGINFEKLKGSISEEIGKKVSFQDVRALSADSVKYDFWKKCVFLVRPPWQTVLVDKEGQIRGYYDLKSREEIDRLRVELKILLKQY